MAKQIRTDFKFHIGSPTNAERTSLSGQGVPIFTEADKTNPVAIIHTLPVYRQADYPNYKTRAKGPFCASLLASGLRVGATGDKMVFAKEEDAVGFTEAVLALFNLFGVPVHETDPRPILLKCMEEQEKIYPPLKALAEQFNATFIAAEKEKE